MDDGCGEFVYSLHLLLLMLLNFAENTLSPSGIHKWMEFIYSSYNLKQEVEGECVKSYPYNPAFEFIRVFSAFSELTLSNDSASWINRRSVLQPFIIFAVTGEITTINGLDFTSC